MGAPAVIAVTDHTGQSRRFYGHWASPQYQIPHLAEFIHQADEAGTPLTVDAYTAYVAAHPNTLPGEDITAERWFRDPTRADGLDYRYTLHLAKDDGGLRYTVAERDRPHDWERMRPADDLTGRGQIYVAAARMCRQMATTTPRCPVDTLVATHPDTTAVLVVAAGLLALSTPAALVFAVLRHLTVLGVAASAASLLLYGGGYLAAVWHRRDLRAALNAARRDPVTGLPTRAVAEQALRTATAERTRLSVALADVDGLRAVNNWLGHAAGDQLLHAIANRLAQAVPRGGLLARLGG